MITKAALKAVFARPASACLGEGLPGSGSSATAAACPWASLGCGSNCLPILAEDNSPLSSLSVNRKLAALAVVVGLAAVSGLAAYWVLAGPGHRSGAAHRGGTPASAAASDTGRPNPMLAKVLHPRRSSTDFQAGVTVLVYHNEPGFAVKAGTLLDRLARLGVNSVSLAFPLFQDSWTANEVRSTDVTPSMDNIRSFVAEAHRRGFTVMLRPLLDEQSFHKDGHWRGEIKPTDRAAWFASYGALLQDYARLGQSSKVEAIDIGTEFVSLQQYNADWLNLIASIRKVFSGELTYSANWDKPYPEFGRELDFLGIDAFYPLAVEPTAKVEQLVQAWQPWLKQVAQIESATSKPMVFTELGTTSETGSFTSPWIWQHKTGLNLDDQRRYYAASCQALKTHLRGMYWWAFDLMPLPDPSTDVGYAPDGKPAELEIERCFR